MEFQQAIEKIKDSDVFKKWKNENNNYYMSHVFTMIDPSVKREWQIGFYSSEKNNIVTFAISYQEGVDVDNKNNNDKKIIDNNNLFNEKITKNPDSEPLDKNILILDISKVKISLNDALNIAELKQKEKYKSYTPIKKIVLLQNLNNSQVWNITYITNTFKTLNIKIDSESGEIIKDELFELFKIDKE